MKNLPEWMQAEIKNIAQSLAIEPLDVTKILIAEALRARPSTPATYTWTTAYETNGRKKKKRTKRKGTKP